MNRFLRFYLYIIISILSSTFSRAQEKVDETSQVHTHHIFDKQISLKDTTKSTDYIKNFNYDSEKTDTVLTFKTAQPYHTTNSLGYFYSTPLPYSGATCINLHEGFNTSISMSIMAGLGKTRMPGVGFGTSLSCMYANKLTEKLIYSVGGYYNRLSWDKFNLNDFGLNLMIGYKINDNLSVYAYGSKSFSPYASKYKTHKRLNSQYYNINGIGDRIGAMLHLKLSDAVSVSVSVEERIQY